MDVPIQQSVIFLRLPLLQLAKSSTKSFVLSWKGGKLNWMPSLKTGGFPCVIGACDGFHVYISSNLKKFFNFKKIKILCYK